MVRIIITNFCYYERKNWKTGDVMAQVRTDKKMGKTTDRRQYDLDTFSSNAFTVSHKFDWLYVVLSN